LSAARSGHTATKLPDGRVLIAGGSSSDGDALAATEIYDAATGSFSAGISLKAARSGHTATVLADGRTVFIGGDAQGTCCRRRSPIIRSSHSEFFKNDIAVERAA
jgi:hypothetical protein